MCAQNESASETGFAIRGREKKMALNERLPTFHPETKIRERGKGGGKVFLHFTVFPISGSCRKQRLGPEPLTGPVLTATFSLQPQLPSQPSLGVGGMS